MREDAEALKFSDANVGTIRQPAFAARAPYPIIFCGPGQLPVDETHRAQVETAVSYRLEVKASYLPLKRAMDIIVSLLALTGLAPVLIALVLLIRLESPGPAIFCQERLGKNKKPFVCLKFRTMIDDAEKHTGPVWTEGDDPRTTRLGRLLRKSRLDELPQLFNVLRGEMSIVGPRPIRQCFRDELAAKCSYYDQRFEVRPGLTGWAQISAPPPCTHEDQLKKLGYDLFYLSRLGLMEDLKIIFRTPMMMIMGRGQ